MDYRMCILDDNKQFCSFHDSLAVRRGGCTNHVYSQSFRLVNTCLVCVSSRSALRFLKPETITTPKKPHNFEFRGSLSLGRGGGGAGDIKNCIFFNTRLPALCCRRSVLRDWPLTHIDRQPLHHLRWHHRTITAVPDHFLLGGDSRNALHGAWARLRRGIRAHRVLVRKG